MAKKQERKIGGLELRLTAAVYTLLGAASYLKEHGRLPDRIGGPWNYLPANYMIQQRGTDFELDEDERPVYEAILREHRLPGGSMVLVDERDKDPKPAPKTKRKRRTRNPNACERAA